MKLSPEVLEAASFATALAKRDMKPGVVQVEIDGLVYTSQKLPASVGLALWPRLVSLLGRGVTEALATGDVDNVDWLSTLIRISDRAMQDGLGPIVAGLLARMQCNKRRGFTDGGPIGPGDGSAFDEHFAGEYLHLLKVCVLAVAHNLRGPTYGRHSSSGAQWPSPYPPDTGESSSPTSTP